MKEAFGKPLGTAQGCVLAERMGTHEEWAKCLGKDGREFERAQGVTDA